FSLGTALFYMGDFAPALSNLEKAIALINPQSQPARTTPYELDASVGCRSIAAQALWALGFPDQALRISKDAITLAQQLSDPFILAYAFIWASLLHLHRGEWQLCYERAEEAISLSYEHNFPFWLAIGSIFKGYALANQGQTELGVSLMCYGLDAERA